MFLTLIREASSARCADAIRGELFVDGTFFCPTLERASVEVLPLCYRVYVTHSPRFNRLLPLLHNVPSSDRKRMRKGIRFHVGTLPRHSSGCILVPDRATETRLTALLLEAQRNREEIYLDIRDARPGDNYVDNYTEEEPYETE